MAGQAKEAVSEIAAASTPIQMRGVCLVGQELPAVKCLACLFGGKSKVINSNSSQLLEQPNKNEKVFDVFPVDITT